MTKLARFRWFYPLILLLLTLFLAYRNYTPGTFLTGWDTLHPEFDFKLNFQRLIFGVWRADQGLGDVAGHSAMADLPRVFILWLFHFFLPLSFLRYAYVFLCLIIGPLSFYYLVRQLLPRHPGIALLSSLVYLFNFGTLQQFYVPFEMFPTQWALLPLIILLTIRCLQHPTKINLLLFFLVNILSTPQSYAAHLWYPFFGLLVLFFFLWAKTNQRPFRLPLILIGLVLATNSFWLLPNLYYITTNSHTPQLHKGNRLHSQEFLERNRETGTLSNTSLIKGFYFNWDAYDFDRSRSDKLMPQWSSHSSLFDVKLIGNLLFFGAFIGLVSVLLSRHPLFFPLTPFFIVPFTLLANNMPIFRNIFDYLLTLPLISEIFRFIFTKMSIFLTFSISLFFAYFSYLLFVVKNSPTFKHKYALLISLSLLIYCFPYFQGYLISPLVRNTIPKDYFNLFEYSKILSPGLALTLPLHQNTGWQYYNWKYQGSGFIWFGLPFGTLDRDSDRWAATNEQAYREFHYALYSQNSSQFLLNLQKFNIKYLIWDTSNIATTGKNQDQVTFHYQISDLLSILIKTKKITPIFNSGQISLYQTNSPTPILISQQLSTNILPPYSRHYSDSAYDGQNYKSQNVNNYLYYPYRNLLTSTDRVNINQFRVKSGPSGWTLADLTTNNRVPLTPIISVTPSDLKQYLSNPNLIPTENFTSFSSFNGTNGIQIELPNLDHSQSYLVGVRSQYITGIPLRLCLFNYYSNLCSLEDELSRNQNLEWDYYLVPPMDNFSGSNLQLNAISYNFRPSSSLVSDIKIFSLLFDQLLSPSNSQILPVTVPINTNFQIIWPNNSLIKVSSPPKTPHLVLFQSFSSGWLSFYFDGLKPVFLNNHFLVNNWANGWEIPIGLNKPVYILFWPQLLQFLGFGLIIATASLVFTKAKK